MNQDNRENSLTANIHLCRILQKDIRASRQALINMGFNPDYPKSETTPPDVELLDFKESVKRHLEILVQFKSTSARIKEHLTSAAAEGGIQKLSNADRKLWNEIKNDVESATSVAFDEKLLDFFFSPAIVELGIIESATYTPSHQIRDILNDAFARLVATPSSHGYSEQNLEQVEHILGYDFFTPDSWWISLQELTPVMGNEFNNRLPGSIRHRLKEIYRSYVFGNHLAAIALSRATLEYAINDRATSLGIPVAQKDGTRPKLGALIETMSDTFPELREHLETIRESGNKTLHPNKKERLLLIEEHIMGTSNNCLTSLRAVLEKIYDKSTL